MDNHRIFQSFLSILEQFVSDGAKTPDHVLDFIDSYASAILAEVFISKGIAKVPHISCADVHLSFARKTAPKRIVLDFLISFDMPE